MAWAIDDGEVNLWKPGEPTPLFIHDSMDKIAVRVAIKMIDDDDLDEFEAHNAGFEKAIWENVLGWPPVKWTCSAAMCAAHSLPRALDKAGAALKLSIQKDQEGKRIMMKLCKPRKPTKDNPAIWHEDPEDYAKLYEYCKDDVRAERAISKAVRSLNKIETKIWQLDQVINERGICVDIDAVEACIKISGQCLERANEEMAVLTNGAVMSVSKTKKLVVWLQERDVGATSVAKEALADLLHTDLPDDVRQALLLRQKMGKTSVAKYKKIKSAVSSDGRLRGQFVYHGTGTGRWAGKIVQTQNLPRIEYKGNLDDYFSILKLGKLDTFELCHPDVMGMMSKLIRPCLIAAEGKDFFGGDYSSIEARVLLWLAGDEAGLDVFRRGEDIYIDMASDIYDIPAYKVDDDQRQLGKQAILGLGYQMGANKFEQTCLGYGIHIDATMAEKVVRGYREKYRLVKSLWYQQEATAVAALTTGKFQTCGKIGWGIQGDYLYCKLPSKRLIAYPFPEMQMVDTPWGEDKNAITYMTMNSVTKKWERTKTYGGKLVENMTQGTARDLQAEAMLRVEDAGYEIVMHTHDEITAEKWDGTIKEFEQLMNASPDWAKGLPTAVKGWKDKRYIK